MIKNLSKILGVIATLFFLQPAAIFATVEVPGKGNTRRFGAQYWLQNLTSVSF